MPPLSTDKIRSRWERSASLFKAEFGIELPEANERGLLFVVDELGGTRSLFELNDTSSENMTQLLDHIFVVAQLSTSRRPEISISKKRDRGSWQTFDGWHTDMDRYEW
jgi:hypothetical protein